MKPQTISAIIIARNAQLDIKDCLTSVAFCNDIILIDNQSTDNTSAIAKKMKARIINSDANDFSKLRNTGLEAAESDWVLYLDADERVSEQLKNEIGDVISHDTSSSAYRIKRKNFYLGNHPWPYVEKLERLFKRSALTGWQGRLHETAKVGGKISDLSGYINHYTHKDLTTMLSKTIRWSHIEAHLRFDSHHPRMTWWRFPRVMTTAFWDSYIRQSGWKAGTVGLIESTYQAFSMFVTYARLWELQQVDRKTKNKASV